jgi:hypothetical protein
MRSSELDLSRYRTDKVANGYLRWYDDLFASHWRDVRAVLELGVHRGGSLELWRDYFPSATIVGIDSDVSLVEVADRNRIAIERGSQADAEFLRSVSLRAAPLGFDLIIDDASHIAADAESSFRALFDDHLKSGGWYVLEDWCTGYLAHWPDGREPRPASRIASRFAAFLRRRGIAMPSRSHAHGMVGFVKKLIDEQGTQARPSKFAEMVINAGLVAIRKA